MANKAKISWKGLSWQMVADQAQAWVTIVVTARVTTILVWGIVVMVVIYLAYMQVWRILTGDLTLPAGVVPTQLSVDADILQQIHEQREAREDYIVPAFRVENILP